MAGKSLAVGDVLNLLAEHERVARRTLNMVPSENRMSGLAKLPMVLDAYHRYFFNDADDPERWHFRGARPLRDLETQLTVPLLSELGRGSHVSVKPLSGLSAMTLVLASLGGEPGSTVVTIDAGNGGHYATALVARRLGLDVDFLRGPDPHRLDLDHAAEVLARRRPALLYVDQSHCLFPIDIPSLVATVRAVSPETRVHVDASHWLGLIFGGVFANPLECGADSYGGSTHKTFPGPQKAVFLTDDAELDKRIRETQDYLISSHHFAATGALGLALLEFRDHGGREYAAAVVANTGAFGRLLLDRGVAVAAADRGFSAGHQLWVDTEAERIPPAVAAERLASAGLRVNFMAGLPGFTGQALRIGLNEPTYQGLAGADIEELADIFVTALRASGDHGRLAQRVARLRRRTPYGMPVAADSPLLRQALSLYEGSIRTDPSNDGPGAGLLPVGGPTGHTDYD